MTKPAVGTTTKKQSFADIVIDNLTYLFNTVLGLLTQDTFQNGSFEVDSNADGIPDGWTETSTGGTIAIETTAANVSHGKQSLKFTSAGAGGGNIISTDFFECSDLRGLTFSWQMKSSIATVTNKVEVLFYDRAQSFLSTSILYTAATGNPTAFALQSAFVTPPATARYAKLKITGADSVTAGSTWYDDFQIVPTVSKAPSAVTSFAASSTWTCPAYVNRVKVRVWGGGGGGVSNSSNGGGGGGYAEGIVTVVPGTVYTVTVGAAGAANGNGGASGFHSLVTAGGGVSGGAGGVGGGASLSVSFSGGSGAAGRAGNAASGGQGGGDNQAGAAPGGGGGGSPASAFPAVGAVGRIIVEY